MTPSQRQAVAGYALSLQGRRGADMADAKIREIDPYQRLFGESYDEGSGYDLPKLAETRSEIDDLEAELEGRIGRDRFASFMDQVIDDPSEAMRMLYRDGATASALNTAQSLAAAWQRALGATERYDDETAGLIEDRKAEAATLMNTDMQSVTTVRMSDGSRAYVVGGQFTASEDGTVDVVASMSGSPTGGMVILLDTETGERRQASVDDIAAVESSTPAEEYLWQVEDGVTRQRDAELQQAIASAMHPREQAQWEAAPGQSSETQTRAEGGASVSGTGSVSESGIEKGLKFRDGDGNVFTYDGTEEDGLERFIHDESGEVIFLRPELVGNSSVGLVPVEDTEEGAGLSPETSVDVRDSEGAGQEVGASSVDGESFATGTALSQIPVDENGKPRFSDADPELAWDALVERTQDEEMAQAYADNMVASREAALEKAEKAKPKANDDLEAFVESERERKEAISAARRELEAWRRISGVSQSRKDAREEEVRRSIETEAQSEPMQQETVPPVAELEDSATTEPETAPVETPLQPGIMETEGKEGTPMQENTPSEGPKPVGRGVFGDIYDQFKGKVKEAIAFLRSIKSGEAVGALHHKDIGDISLVWGDRKAGLDKILNKHPEVVDNLQELLDEMEIVQQSDNRIVLESPTHKAVVSREWFGKPRESWLLTAYEKKEKPVSASSIDIETEPGGKRNGTATPQNELSGDKGMESSDNLQVETQEKIETESNGQAKSASESGEFSHLTDDVSKMEPQESEMETVSEKRSGASDALSELERAGLGESDVAGELRRMAADGEEKSQEASDEEYQAGQATKRQDTGNQEKVDKKREESGPVEKIEDVGEKIGGARKDQSTVSREKLKEADSNPASVKRQLIDLPFGRIFAFDYDLLRKEGVPNEVITAVRVIRNSVKTKPRIKYKLERWVSETFAKYYYCLLLIAGEEKYVEKIGSEYEYGSSGVIDSNINGRINAALAVGGYDSGIDTGNASLQKLNETAGYYKEGKWISEEGKWYVRDAGIYSGIYDTRDDAVAALKSFALKEKEKEGHKPTEFSIYQRRDGSCFITPKGKPGIIVADGFVGAEDARAYLSNNYEDLNEKYGNIRSSSKAVFNDNRVRSGKDWRGGKDVTAEEFRRHFGFRGVEFGNWMTQADRQKALNECYDALMDLSEAIGKSPDALSLGGELSMAFGSRGVGKANAHYEPGKVVINITKTKGSGSLAHEWWHAVDHYFARRRGEQSGFNTDQKGYGFNVGRKTDRNASHRLSDRERQEITKAFEDLMNAIDKSGYKERSSSYSRLKGSSYWNEPTELGARAFAVWVARKLSQRGTQNDYLSNNPVFESYTGDKRFYAYPLEDDYELLDPAFDHLFETIEEKTEDGNRVLFQQTDETLNNDSEARGLATTAVLEALHQAGIDVEVATPEMVEEVLGRDEARLSAKQKRALETVSVQNSDEHQQTVISSADGAKILENLDTLAKEYEKNPKTNEKTFIGEVAKALGMTDKGKSSQYATFETKNGKVITLRLSNHNATVSNFDNRGEADGISIVVSAKKNEGVRNDGDAHVVEYYYDAIKLRKAEGKPLAEIVRSLEQALYSGEYQDNTGLADRQEVNGEDHIELMQTPSGMVYGWTVGGKIYLTESGLNPNTPVHEYTHLWAEAMRRRNPKGWASVKDLLRGTPVWQEVLEDENYSSIRDNEDEVASEALSRLSGRENARKLEREAERILDSNAGMPDKVSSLALLGRMREALKRFWRWAGKNLFGIDRFRSIDEVTDRVLYDLVSGTDLRTGDLRESMDAVNERFNEQLDRLENGEMPSNEYLSVGRPTGVMREFIPDLPVIARQKVIRKAINKHGLSISDIKNLPSAMSNPIFVFRSKAGTISILTELKDNSGRNIFVSVELSVEKQMGHQFMEVNDVLTIHGREIENVVLPIVENDSLVWVNKEKGQRWLSSAKSNSQAIANDVLSSAAKVIENFENPSIGGEKNVNGPESEEESIVRRSKEDGSYMKAPNGAPTRLNERQWVQVRTKAFKDWFGDWESEPENSSKVVDENGEPLVVYHGTTADQETKIWDERTRSFNTEREPFTIFKRRVDGEKNSGFFFSDNQDNAGGYGYNTYDTYLNLRNPLVIDANGANYTDVEHDGARRDTYGWAGYAEKNGFDGVVFKNISDGVDIGSLAETNTDYVAFSPNQIKSATDNTGSFSESSDDIRFSIVSEAASSLRDEVDGVGDDAEKLKVVRRRMADFVGRHLTSEAGKEMYKSEIMRLIRQVSNARSSDEAEMYLRRLKTVMNRAELREATRGLERLTHQRMTTKTDKGVRRGRLVDDRTRGLIEGIRETLGELMATGVDEDLRGLRKELKSLKPEEGMSGDALADLESRRASLTIEIRDLEERRDALRRGNLEETSKAVDEAISELEDEFTERGYLSESKQARYEQLLMKRRYIEVREGLSGLSETEARQKSAAEELTSLRSQLREEQSRGDEDAVSATLAEMARVRGLQPAFSVAGIWNVNKNPIT